MLLLAAAPDPANAPHHPAPSWGDPTAQYSWERGGYVTKLSLKITGERMRGRQERGFDILGFDQEVKLQLCSLTLLVSPADCT